MLAGLSALELGRLRVSVGYGTHKTGRLLTPIEVGKHLRKARDASVSLRDCARVLNLDGTGQINRFLRILDLHPDLQHDIIWGSRKGAIGFSAAFELTRIQSAEDQRIVAKSILEDGLKSKEVRQIAQLRERSGRPIQECLNEVLDMRPTIEKSYVFIGSIIDRNVEGKLVGLMQVQRDSVLKAVIEDLDLKGASGRLGTRFFTLVGDERFDESMKNIGRENLEAQIRTHISKAIVNA